MFRRISTFGRKLGPTDDDQLGLPDAPAVPRPRSPSPSPSTATTVTQDLTRSGSTLFGRKAAEADLADAGPLGLSVVYTPRNGHRADIVFIHGLGGTSHHTWSKVKDPTLFWPLTFLPLEPDICLARILTFGYNATLRKNGSMGMAMLDFAKDLLFDLKYAKDDDKEDLNMGDVPLIFVVHSMGGLIVKEAYMQGQHDPEYSHIIKSVVAINFLATPHRGTNLAQTLNRILQSTVATSSKQYIAEVSKNSLSLQKLNEQFRHIAPKLDIVSFYETKPTPIGLKNVKVMILEKDSSVLGYPGETSKALDADHHNVCKYDSPQDPNYIAVRNILKTLVSKIISKGDKLAKTETSPSNRRHSLELHTLLATTELPMADYSFFRDQWAQGTSNWIFDEEAYLAWRYSPALPTAHRLLWLNGGPAAGKSVMSSLIINRLVEDGERCQYFYIRYGDRQKRSLSLLLRSIAYQLAQSLPGFMEKIIELVDEGIHFGTADPRIIWMRIFKSILFVMQDEEQPLYWVIDGLDEAEDPRGIVKLLSEVSSSRVPIRILLVGRESPEMESYFKRVPEALHPSTLTIEGKKHDNDLCRYVQDELDIPGSAEFRKDIAQRILESAQNNFLWVRLAVDKVNLCHRQADVEAALQEIPAGMEALYDRMATMIYEIPSPADRELALTILQYTSCALRALTVAQLAQALGDDTSGMLDLERSIVDLCSGFVVIDSSSTVTMIHQTAREYLMNSNSRSNNSLTIDRSLGHEELFTSCMERLMTIGLRAKIARNQIPEFLDYAATSWSSHLLSARLGRRKTAQILKKFLTGAWALTWIEYLATTSQVRVLVQASKHLSKYADKFKSLDTESVNDAQQMEEAELFESWAIDLTKVAGKFGTALRRSPKSIYKLIPPFCPQTSSIYQHFGKPEAKSLAVSGLSSQTWDDLAARIPLGDGMFASSLEIAGNLIFVLTSSRKILVFDASTFEETAVSPILHGEHVSRMHANKRASLLVTYGYRTTKVWDTATGLCKTTIANLPSRPRPLVLQFMKDSTSLFVGFDDKKIRSVDLKAAEASATATWEAEDLVADLDEPELDGHILNAANYMALNEDASLVAVAYRGHPFSAWETEGPVHIGHCWRQRNQAARGEVIQGTWLPQSPEFLGLYIEGVVFKWSPYENEVEELLIGANRLTLSRDGGLFVTGDGKGAVKVFTTEGFCPLYQLASQDPVFDIVFSPGSYRFYDVRGSYVNVWEANALMSFAEENSGIAGFDSESETDSVARSTPTAISQRIDAITTLATTTLTGSRSGKSSRLFFSGTENGLVRLHNVQQGLLADVHMSPAFMRIEQLSCSNDGQYLFFSDLGGKVTIMSITAADASLGSKDANDNPRDLPALEKKAELRIQNDGSILSLVSHKGNAGSLLVHTSSSLHIISLEPCVVTHSMAMPHAAEMVWIHHPTDAELIVGFAPSYVLVLDWDLKEQGRFSYHGCSVSEDKENRNGLQTEARVDQVMPTRSNSHIMVKLSHRTVGGQREPVLVYFEMSSITPSTQPPETAQAEPNPGDATKPPDTPVAPRIFSLSEKVPEMRRLLAFLKGNRLVFLSKTYSVCTWQLPAGPAKELFVLPGDWINKDCLDLCSVWEKEKAFLCPRNGEVAVVKCAGLV